MTRAPKTTAAEAVAAGAARVGARPGPEVGTMATVAIATDQTMAQARGSRGVVAVAGAPAAVVVQAAVAAPAAAVVQETSPLPPTSLRASAGATF